ncbi:MAG: SGNH/GDSL hydrolase family protein, partial [Lachnospiraceae bacterium]|nr:SGNH/GDSL hydrolase family protein [Lachnospiraceae bacterium]
MGNMNETLLQPKAPKDPVKKDKSFFVMRNKDVCGAPTPEGKGVQFIYESDGRLESSAKLVGNITDEEEIKLLGSVEGFKKLVSQIGVCVETEDYNTEVLFCFQMYGKTDPYVSGTTIKKSVKGDGAEALINLDEVEWSDDDNIPGQIRFEFPEAGMLGKVSVRFYLNEGFDAPVPEEEESVDFESDGYAGIISKSLINKGNNARLKKAISKARNGEDVTIAFIGGSITQGAGAIPINNNCYARKTFEGFCRLCGKSTDENIHYVKAGVGGTPSELGMIRYERDVLDNGKIEPDVVVIEFAVNDAGDETNGRCYESLARKAYNGPGKPAVILLFAVFEDDFNLEERLSPVGYALNLPMVSTKASVTEQFYLKPEEGRVVSKNQFFYDCFHPTNTGHRIMADGILHLLSEVDKCEADAEIESLDVFPFCIGGEFENVKLIDKKDNFIKAVIEAGDFTGVDEELQRVEMNMDLNGTPEFPNNWMYNGGTNKPLTMEVECKSLLIVYKDSASPSVGAAEVYADGELKLTIDPHIVGWTHCNPFIVFENEEKALHKVEVKMRAGDEDKAFTV